MEPPAKSTADPDSFELKPYLHNYQIRQLESNFVFLCRSAHRHMIVCSHLSHFLSSVLAKQTYASLKQSGIPQNLEVFNTYPQSLRCQGCSKVDITSSKHDVT